MLTEAELLKMELAEYNVLVRMDPVESKTAGGLHLPDSMVAQNTIAADLGTLVRGGELAFSYADGWTPPNAGDRVLIAQYDGKLYEVGDAKYRVVKDKSVVGFWRQSPALAQAA